MLALILQGHFFTIKTQILPQGICTLTSIQTKAPAGCLSGTETKDSKVCVWGKPGVTNFESGGTPLPVPSERRVWNRREKTAKRPTEEKGQEGAAAVFGELESRERAQAQGPENVRPARGPQSKGPASGELQSAGTWKLGRGRDSNQADFLGRSRAPAPPEPPGPRGAQGEGAGGNPAGPAGRRRFTRGHPGKTQVQGAESPPLASPSLMSQGEGERPLRGDQGAEQPREETWSPRLRRGVSQASSGEGQAPPRTPGAPHVPTWSKGARIRGNRTSCWGKPWGLPGARLLRHLGRGLHTASHHLPVLGGL